MDAHSTAAAPSTRVIALGGAMPSSLRIAASSRSTLPIRGCRNIPSVRHLNSVLASLCRADIASGRPELGTGKFFGVYEVPKGLCEVSTLLATNGTLSTYGMPRASARSTAKPATQSTTMSAGRTSSTTRSSSRYLRAWSTGL